MGKWKRARLILVIWAVLVLCLAVYAIVAKRMRQDSIAARAVAVLTADAESGTVEGSDYLYGFGWQGPMVDLIERGRHYPAMERVMLLLEARRVHDWVYLYPRYRNADLRAGLIRHCLEHYPADPLVHWAVGRLKLISGEYTAAADELVQAKELGFDPQAASVPAVDFQGRYETALILAGRVDEVLAAARDEFDEQPDDDRLAARYFDLLCLAGEYESVTAVTEARAREGRISGEFWRAQLRAYLWSGRIEDYLASGQDYVQLYSGSYVEYTRAMLELLQNDFSGAMALSGERDAEQEWWMEWYQGWHYYRRLADAYAATGDQAYLNEMDSWRDYVRWEKSNIEGRDDATWDERDAARNMASELIFLAGQKGRAHALRGEWDAAAAALAEADPEDSYRKDAAYQATSALLAISRGEELEEYSLADLASTGAVVSLLLSPQLADAARESGRSLDDAREALVRAVRPDIGNYWWYEYQVLDW